MLMNFACRVLGGGTTYTRHRKHSSLHQAVHVTPASVSNASADICLAEVGKAEGACIQPGAQLEWPAASCPRQQRIGADRNRRTPHVQQTQKAKLADA